jgi:predicted nucleic acid-binding protein
VRAVLDVNVVLSGLFWHGPPHELLGRVRDGTLTLRSNPAPLAELIVRLGPRPPKRLMQIIDTFIEAETLKSQATGSRS